MNTLKKRPTTSFTSQPFAAFLAAVVRQYPTEAGLLLGEADVSPETAQGTLHPQAWATKLFQPEEITDPREFERAALALRHFHDVLNGNRANMPSLSDATFTRLHTWLEGMNFTEADLQATIWAILFNDLGKLKACHEWYTQITGTLHADHDAVLAFLLQETPERFPGFAALPKLHRQALIKGFGCGFNLGQAAQLECPVASWDSFQLLSSLSRKLFVVHALFDILGVTGATDPQAGSPRLLNDDNVAAFLHISSYLDVVTSESYNEYLYLRGEKVGTPPWDKEDIAFVRLAGMARLFSWKEADKLRHAWTNLAPAVKALLTRELAISGYGKAPAILPYYAPALIANTLKRNPEDGLNEALTFLGRMFFDARRHLGYGTEGGVVIANLLEVSKAALTTNLATLRLRLEDVAGGVMVHPETFPRINLGGESYQVENLPGKRCAFVGLGGGSDANQAAVLALMQDADAAVISVRSATLGSEVGTGKIGEMRTLDNAWEIFPGVYRINKGTTSNGRVTESFIANILVTYVVLDANDGALATQLQHALDDFGDVVEIIGVDTGGDALHPMNTGNAVHDATPDQDLQTMLALRQLANRYTIRTAILAVGVDSPANAEDILRAANAEVFAFSLREQESIIRLYDDWGMGMNATQLIGKTPLALQMAFLTSFPGTVHTLPIPLSYVLKENRPWSPFVNITEEMRNVYVMNLEDHLRAINA